VISLPFDHCMSLASTLWLSLFVNGDRFGANAIHGNSVESRIPLKSFPTATTNLPTRVSENMDPAKRMSCCPQCTQNHERELAKLVATEYENSSYKAKPDAPQPPLPQWLQNAKGLNIDIGVTNQSQVYLLE
jgi:hypothetical protein